MLLLSFLLATGFASGQVTIRTIAGAPLQAVSPDSLVVMEGAGIAPGYGQAGPAVDHLPDLLGGARVLVGVEGVERPASLLAVSPNRIEFLIPKLPAGARRVTIRAEHEGMLKTTGAISVTCVDANPAVVHSEGYPSITDAEAREIRGNEPLEQGREYNLYATGLGRSGASSIALYVNGVREEVKQSSMVMAGVYQVRFRHRGAGVADRALAVQARLIAGGRETGFTVLAK